MIVSETSRLGLCDADEKQLSMAATVGVIWLWYWPYHGVGTCASVLIFVKSLN